MKYDLYTVWYHAEKDVIFQSGYLEGLFCALMLGKDFWRLNPHIELIGILE
jgi:hypothetical protein